MDFSWISYFGIMEVQNYGILYGWTYYWVWYEFLHLAEIIITYGMNNDFSQMEENHYYIWYEFIISGLSDINDCYLCKWLDILFCATISYHIMGELCTSCCALAFQSKKIKVHTCRGSLPYRLSYLETVATWIYISVFKELSCKSRYCHLTPKRGRLKEHFQVFVC